MSCEQSDPITGRTTVEISVVTPASTAMPHRRRWRSLASRAAFLILCAATAMTLCLFYIVFTSATASYSADAKRSGTSIKAAPAAANLTVRSNPLVDHNNHSAGGMAVGLSRPSLPPTPSPPARHFFVNVTSSVTGSPSRLNHSEQFVEDGAVPATSTWHSYTKISGRVIPGTADVLAARYGWTRKQCQAACDRTEACRSYMFAWNIQHRYLTQCELWSRAYGMRLSDWICIYPWRRGKNHKSNCIVHKIVSGRYSTYFKNQGELPACAKH